MYVPPAAHGVVLGVGAVAVGELLALPAAAEHGLLGQVLGLQHVHHLHEFVFSVRLVLLKLSFAGKQRYCWGHALLAVWECWCCRQLQQQ